MVGLGNGMDYKGNANQGECALGSGLVNAYGLGNMANPQGIQFPPEALTY